MIAKWKREGRNPTVGENDAEMARLLDLMTAVEARKTAQALRAQGFPKHADAARGLVRSYLKRWVLA